MAAVRDIDKGWDRIAGDLIELDESYTKIGVMQGTVHGGKTSAGRSGGAAQTSDLVKIAAVQELGSKKKNIPPRPANKQAFEKNKRKIVNLKKQLINRVYENRVSIRRALGILGEFHTANVQKRITDLKTPPLKPATIKAKGSSNPLIDTGQYRQSITHVEVIR